jgi:phosphoribosylaminoimidazolecarboxamide formyltransferase/IMP cyclohydrolase
MLEHTATPHGLACLTITQAGSLKLRTHSSAASASTLETRTRLALKTFEHTAQYDGAIANYLGQEEDGFSHTINLQFNKTQSMRYGENPFSIACSGVQSACAIVA